MRSQIQRISGCRIVAACDREPMMASQFCERFNVQAQYYGFESMLRESATRRRSHHHAAGIALSPRGTMSRSRMPRLRREAVYASLPRS